MYVSKHKQIWHRLAICAGGVCIETWTSYNCRRHQNMFRPYKRHTIDCTVSIRALEMWTFAMYSFDLVLILTINRPMCTNELIRNGPFIFANSFKLVNWSYKYISCRNYEYFFHISQKIVSHELIHKMLCFLFCNVQ